MKLYKSMGTLFVFSMLALLPVGCEEDYMSITNPKTEQKANSYADYEIDWTEAADSVSTAFIERFYCIAQRDPNPPHGRYERYPVHDCALLMTAADDNFWTFELAVTYYRQAIVNYLGFTDRGMLLAVGCGSTNGKPQIDKTSHLGEAYEFGRNLYPGRA